MVVDDVARKVVRGGVEVDLTRTEFALLELLMLNPRQVLTRSTIFERVWGYDFGPESNSLDVYSELAWSATMARYEPTTLPLARSMTSRCLAPVS